MQNEPSRTAALTAPLAGFDGPSSSRNPATSPRTGHAPAGGAFGSASSAAPTKTRTQQQVAQTAFGDAQPARPAAAATGANPPQAAVSTPVEITFKPKPAYTDEARRLQIEGEVVIEAVFKAGGQVEVLRIIRGLGHGLNESAVTAARAIRFRPAKQHGQPVDSNATVRMMFELAY
jgi:TonB family protein